MHPKAEEDKNEAKPEVWCFSRGLLPQQSNQRRERDCAYSGGQNDRTIVFSAAKKWF